jgi:hypothetical protein
MEASATAMSATDLHQRAVHRTRLLWCGTVKVARLRECRTGGESKRKGTGKPGFDKIVFHNALHLRGGGESPHEEEMSMEPANENTISIAVPIEGNSAMHRTGLGI